MKFFLCVLCLFCVVCVTACRRQTPTATTAREDAYRANNLGVALLEQFRYPEAAAAFREALDLDASLAIAHLNLSLALLYAQDLEGAAREANEAARLMPSAPQPPYALGLIARAQNRNDDAVRFFERVRQIDAGDVGANVNLGQIYLQDRKYAEAIAVLGPAAADEPYNVTAAYSLGLALTRAGRREEGQRMLEQSQTLGTKAYAVTFGNSYLEQGRLAEAITSTGAEPELVDPATSAAAFTPVATATTITSRGGTAGSPVGAPAAQASPFGRAFSASDLDAGGSRRLAGMLGGGLTLVDYDADGDLDVFATSLGRQHLLQNDGRGGAWIDVTVRSGFGVPSADTVPIGVVAGDYDNDGLADLFVLAYGGNRLYHNDGNGRFRDVTAAARLPSYPFLPGAAAFVDVDHDGDLDIVIAGLADVAATRVRANGRMMIFPRDFAPAPIQLLRNNGNATWTDITRDARLQAATHAIAIVPTDFDNRRDIDLLIVNSGLPPMLFQNVRDGTFRDVAGEVGLTAIIGSDDGVAAVAAGDVNKDDFPDLFLAGAARGVFALSDGRGRFTAADAPAMNDAVLAVQFADYDNDGLLDLLAWSAEGPRVYRHLGQRWNDVSDSAVRPPATGTLAVPDSPRAVAVADLDGDGDSDVITGADGYPVMWRNSGDDRHRALRVGLKGRVSNRLGIGSKVEMRAGSLRARFETSSATPPVGSADITFGLGARAGADVVRLLWPSGVLQAEAGGATTTLSSPLSIEELDRKPSSCPFLFAWNGHRFEFITDFMGGGEIGYWEAPGRYNKPDPVEYVRIRGDQLQAKDGRFDLRVTNELEETLYADRFQLVAIAHPSDTEIFPDEGLTDPPKPFRLYAVRDRRAPARVVDDRGLDVTDTVARIDRRYPDEFAVAPFRGYADEHMLTIDLGAASAAQILRPVLLLTGWTDYAFSSDNRAAHQAGLGLAPPSLQIRDATGRWRTAISQIGIPVGRPQTIAVDLSGHLRRGEHQVRIVTNMRIYWDQIRVGTGVPTTSLRLGRIDPQTAMLRARGFSGVVRPDGKEPETYDYERVSAVSPWKAMPGRYTREGDVRELLARQDDMFAIAKPGDEIALSFDAAAAAPLPDGWTRTFLLLADGFSKEMDINSGSPDVVEPLPFHAMTRYPYAGRERYPDTPAHRAYRDTYNTRVVVKSLPSLDRIGR